MRKIIFLSTFLLIILLATIVYGAGYFSLTVDNTVGGVSLPAACSGSTGAFMVLETAQIRFTLDGTAPTTSTGVLLEIGQNLTLTGSTQISNFKAIRTGVSSGVLNGMCW